jgi:HEAT repeat protein
MGFSNGSGRRSLPIFFFALALLVVLVLQNGWISQAQKPAAPEITNSAVNGLNSPNALDRAKAVKALRVERDASAVPALLNHLDDSDQTVGLYVAQALGDLATPNMLPSLRSALLSSNPDVRWRAAFALGKLRDVQSVNDLAALLRDPDVSVQSAAADALAQIANRDALEALTRVLGDAQASTPYVAMSALEKVGEPAVPVLIMATSSNIAQARLNAVTTLGYIASPQAAPALQLAVVDPDTDVAAEAEWALTQIVRPQTRP